MERRNPRQQRKWAALVYIAGDNNLSDNGLQDVQELCDARAANAGREEGVNSLYVGVEIDTKGEHEGSIRYEITDEGNRTVLERLNERDTGDPRALIDFLRWGFSRFPAERYLVVIWGHGEGFKLRRGVALDSTGGSLDIPGVAQALATVGLQNGRKVDVLGFDACLMSMVEVAHCLRDHVKVLVGSQQTEPGDGWPYDKVLRAMRSVKTGEKLGESIVNLYIQRCIADRVPNVTQSALDLERIDRVMAALGELGRALAGGDRDAVLAARMQTQAFYMADYVDLVDLCQKLKVWIPGILPVTNAVVAAAEEGKEKAILTQKSYGPAVIGARGLSVWFPTDPMVYDKFRSEYLSLEARICTRCHSGHVLPGARCAQCNTRSEARASGLLNWMVFLDWYHGVDQAEVVTASDSDIPPPPTVGSKAARRLKRRKPVGRKTPPGAPLWGKGDKHTPARTGNGGSRRLRH